MGYKKIIEEKKLESSSKNYDTKIIKTEKNIFRVVKTKKNLVMKKLIKFILIIMIHLLAILQKNIMYPQAL